MKILSTMVDHELMLQNEAQQMPYYNIQQRVMALNWFSNMASNKFGTAEQLQKELATTLHNLLQDTEIVKMIGNWTIEWGPVVLEEGWDTNKQYHVATNAMYVARQKGTDGQGDHYVIAIAGTNALSLYGWFIEDFNTHEMVQWSQVLTASAQDLSTGNVAVNTDNPGAPRVSMGTARGLGTLLGMEWQAQESQRKFLIKRTKSTGEVQSLLEFLREKFAQSTSADKLTVTGHSLGGALSASMALYLYEMQAKDWNPSKTVELTAMPTAGASPGNKSFSNYYGNLMGLKTLRVWNRLDPVPYGHQPDMLQYLPQLYYPYIIPDAGVYGFAGFLLSRSYAGTTGTSREGGFYTQLMPETAGMPGQFNSVSQPIPTGVIFRVGVDVFYTQVFKMLNIPDKLSKAIIGVINDILKIQSWLGLEGYFLKLIYEAIIRIPGVESAIKLIMSAIQLVNRYTSSLLQFVGQLGYQHVWAYPNLLGMKGFQEAIKKYMKDDQPHDDFEKILKYSHSRLEALGSFIFGKDLLEAHGLKAL